MPGTFLFVVTSHSELGSTGNKTGWYLPEVAHPYQILTKAGYEVKFMSPKGKKSPMDPGSKEMFKDDQGCKDFLAKGVELLDNTLTPDQVKPSDYIGIFYAGGHGPMFDLPQNNKIASLCTTIYENGGIVGAVCHGTVGLLPVKVKSGELLVKGKTLTSFTNEEEVAVKLMEVMPFPLETKLAEAGAKFVAGKMFEPNVQVCGRIVTGQNPASASPMAEEMIKVVKGLKK